MNKFVFYNTQEEYTLALKYLTEVMGQQTYGNIPDEAAMLPGYFRWNKEGGQVYYGSKYNFQDMYKDTPRENTFTLKVKTVVEFEAQEPLPEIIEIHGVEWVLSDVVKAIQQADLTPWNEPKGYTDGLPC